LRSPYALLFASLVAAAVQPAIAQADWEPDGSVAGQLHFELGGPGERGGTILVDLWESWGAFRLGLAAGVGVLTGSNDEGESNRVFAPVGLTLGFVGTVPTRRGGRLGVSGILRVGPWGGATNDGLRGGFWLSVGGSLDLPWGDRLVVSILADYWLIVGNGAVRSTLAPGVALRWTLPERGVPL